MREAIEEVMELMAVKSQEKNIEFACEVAPDLPAGLAGDEPHLRQILANLASNVIKLTDDGEVVIDISTERGDEDQLDLRMRYTILVVRTCRKRGKPSAQYCRPSLLPADTAATRIRA